jgi:3-phenylpropionate/trans-cinnamate dioxygenase ferredoxin reductase subunit
VSIVIVGASVAGIRTAQALRMNGFVGSITLLGDELHHPYDKPPLSKQMIGTDESYAAVPLLTVDELAALDVDLRLGVRATALDPHARVVTTADGGEVPYTQLVIATGVTPRALPFPSVGGVHTVRTADDAIALRESLAGTPRVVVIGAGFIGAEFASAARDFGCPVAIVEMQAVPMAHILGPEIGDALADLHRSAGVDVHTGVGVDHFDSDASGLVTGVVLTDGRVLPADLVVVGIGARPATDWLAGSGLPIDDGVECDERLRVIGFPDIHAAGDVARWPHALYGVPLRIEHWTNANEHAATVAADLLDKPAPSPQLPYVWSDQYGHRIQIAGRPGLGSLAVRQGDAHDRLVALYADSDSTAVGAVVMDDPRAFMKIRKAIVKRQLVAEVALPAREPAST